MIIATNPTTWNNVLYREYRNQHFITLPCCRLIITDDSDINTPAVAAAYAVKKYSKQAQDEISFEVSTEASYVSWEARGLNSRVVLT